MAQKNATPNRKQAETMKKHKLNPLEWVVVKDLDYSMIVKNRITGEFKCIEK